MDNLSNILGGWGSGAPPTVAPETSNPQGESAEMSNLQHEPAETDHTNNGPATVEYPTPESAPSQSRALIAEVGSLFEDVGKRLAEQEAEEQRIKTQVVSSTALQERDKCFSEEEEKLTTQNCTRVVAELRRAFEDALNDEADRINKAEQELQKLVEAGISYSEPALREKTIQEHSSKPLVFGTSVVINVSDLKDTEQVKKVQGLIAKYEAGNTEHDRDLVRVTRQKLDEAVQEVARRVCGRLGGVFSEAEKEFAKFGSLTWEIPDANTGGLPLGRSWDREQSVIEGRDKRYKRQGTDRKHWVLRDEAAGNEAYEEDAKKVYTNEASYKVKVEQEAAEGKLKKLTQRFARPKEKVENRPLREEGREIRISATLHLNRGPNMDLINAVWTPPNDESESDLQSTKAWSKPAPWKVK